MAQCGPCGVQPGISTSAADVDQLDKVILRNVGTLILFAVIMIAGFTILGVLGKKILNLYREWRSMTANVNAMDTQVASALEVHVDDEVYQQDIEMPMGEAQTRGEKVQSAMDRLEGAYSAYNKQIAQHAKDVLQQPQIDDKVDRRVLDRAHDDFSGKDYLAK